MQIYLLRALGSIAFQVKFSGGFMDVGFAFFRAPNNLDIVGG